MSESPYPFIEVSRPTRSSTVPAHNLVDMSKVGMDAKVLVKADYADMPRSNGPQIGLPG
jgi:hypothetical protein